MKKAWLAFILLTAGWNLLTACDMAAFIVRKGLALSDFNAASTDPVYTNYDVPRDYLHYVMSRSNPTLQNDGYGLIYYPQDTEQIDGRHGFFKYVHGSSDANHVWYTGNVFQPQNPPDVFDHAYGKISSPEAAASIVLCHARNASSNPFAPGNHPFRLTLNGTTYSLMHNGVVSAGARTFMINEINALDNEWFEESQPNFPDFPNAGFPGYWIDSEVLFHYLVCSIVHNNNSVYHGLKTGLKKLEDYLKQSTNIVNFVFSDGKQLYAFRSTSMFGAQSSYKLSFRVSDLGFSAVRTGVPAANETQLAQYELIVLKDNGNVVRYPQILDDPLTTAPLDEDDLTALPNRTVGAIVNPNQMGIGISFYLDRDSKVSLGIYNLKGQLVQKLSDGYMRKGTHNVRWNGTDGKGKPAARGIYYLELRRGNERAISKIVYTR